MAVLEDDCTYGIAIGTIYSIFFSRISLDKKSRLRVCMFGWCSSPIPHPLLVLLFLPTPDTNAIVKTKAFQFAPPTLFDAAL